jgi:uncharacterized protein
VVQLILKVASRCNLNCTYCYVYNKGDTSWRRRPARMSDEVFGAALRRAADYCRAAGEDSLTLCFHGGEPCLVGVPRLSEWCVQAREELAGLRLNLTIQTNGTLLDERWVAAFEEHRVGVGVSIDGPREIHDRCRVDHGGRGSHDRVVRGLGLLRDGDLDWGLLCVIPLGADPIAVHEHLLGLGAPAITYLFPDFTHDTIAPVRDEHGPTPCADFLLPVFDHWTRAPFEVRVRDLWNVSRVVMGGSSEIETIGNPAPHYFFVETDGAIEGLDSLRVCEDGIAATDLNVLTSDLADMRRVDGLISRSIFNGMPLPTPCRGCPEAETCAGGNLPHRYSAARRFDNESVWCADLKKLFTHVRAHLGVTIGDTREHRRRYRELRETVAAGALATEQAER